MDTFTQLLYAALAVAGLGCIVKARRWFTPRALSLGHIPGAFKGLLLDVLFQRRIAGNGWWRYLMHSLIFGGFMGLLIMHAMDELISERWFPDYAPTFDPYQWLRDAFGIAAIAGLGIAGARRIASRKAAQVTGFQDWAFLFILSSIMVSGIVLEAAKIISPHVFDRMEQTYLASDDAQEINALKLYWATQNGVIFDPPPRGDTKTLAAGREIHETSCSFCHSPTSSAVAAYPLARALAGAAGTLNDSRADVWLYWVHVLLCFVGLALLPWGKFFHPVSTAVNLTARKGVRLSTPGNGQARALGIDACTHCGACSEHCSVAPSYAILGTPEILPSEKLTSLAQADRGAPPKSFVLALAEGSHICTECLRCTEVCPAGIDLQDIWLHSKQALTRRGYGNPHIQRNQLPGHHWAKTFRELPPAPEEESRTVKLSDNADSFWGCIQCTTCTSVCPVVAASDTPAIELDLMPQQIMNMLRMGLKKETLGAGMVWNCVTCYKCQEHCPQGVRVADVLYELRNIAAGRMRTIPSGEDL